MTPHFSRLIALVIELARGDFRRSSTTRKNYDRKTTRKNKVCY